MGLSEKLLEKLACPKCHGLLLYSTGDSRLDCSSCNVAYRVENEIPLLNIDEAENLM